MPAAPAEPFKINSILAGPLAHPVPAARAGFIAIIVTVVKFAVGHQGVVKN